MGGKGEDQRGHVACLRLQSCPMTKQRLEVARARKRKVLGTELKGSLLMIPVVEIKKEKKKSFSEVFFKKQKLMQTNL